ncbi:MAG: radical SAM protein [Methanomassiliicoccales archaeon]|nr:radical SAM protein [Methanomassiliicoccales archaeon]
MRLITINRAKPNASVEFYGCPMQCKYCSHTTAAFRDHDLDTVVKAMSDNDIRSVFIGGTEPSLHGKDALDLIRILKKRGKEVLLKTTALDPDFVASTKGMISRYVLEVKSPLDDPETFSRLTSYDLAKSKEHLEKTKRTLDILKGEKIRATLRVIPDEYDAAKVERIALDLKGHADELLLTQFLSNPGDMPYGSKTSPGPSQETMMEMERAARKHIPRVRVRGNGFDVIF